MYILVWHCCYSVDLYEHLIHVYVYICVLSCVCVRDRNNIDFLSNQHFIHLFTTRQLGFLNWAPSTPVYRPTLSLMLCKCWRWHAHLLHCWHRPVRPSVCYTAYCTHAVFLQKSTLKIHNLHCKRPWSIKSTTCSVGPHLSWSSVCPSVCLLHCILHPCHVSAEKFTL